MAGRKIRDVAEARTFLDAAEASRMTRAQWARENGIDGRSLNAWRLNLERRRTATPTTLRVVELVPTATPRVGTPLRVRCGRFVVEVDDDFDDDILTRLLTVVAAC